MLCKKLHHAAYRCRDARETTTFYTEVLGLKFSHAMGEDHVPSTGKYSPHVHIFFEMEDGSNIAFFECPRDPGNVKDMEALLRAKADMQARGMTVVGPTNHDDFISSIYFFDPSGHRLELTTRTCRDTARLQSFVEEAPQVLALWETTHDWSQRHTLFGGGTGYARQSD